MTTTGTMSGSTGTRTRTGREYLRVSLDRSGRARSVEEQHDDNERAAADRGVTLAAPYVDNSVSASRYSTKERGDFAAMLADLRSGRFGAEELVLWEHSRGSRRVGEWVELIEACERAGVVICVTTHGRSYDPANGRDRRSLLEDAVDSEYESSKVSVRSKRASAASAAAGLPNGRVPFGYRRIYDPMTRRLVRQEPHPDHAPLVRELYARLLAGHSLRSIAADFDRRGIRNASGNPFSAQHLREMALTAAYVGLRSHNPGQAARHSLEGAVRGVWEPLVSEETYYGVRRLLSAPERKTSRPGRGVHLLSMIARCAECGGPLVMARRYNSARTASVETYACQKNGCVRVKKADLDDYVERELLGYLAEPDVYEPHEIGEGDGAAQLAAIRDDLARSRSELAELRAGVVAGRLSVANLIAVEPGIIARVDALEAQERELVTPAALRDLIAPGADVAESWHAAPMSTRRAVARLLLAPDRMGELEVTRRASNTGRRNTPVDLRVVYRKGESD